MRTSNQHRHAQAQIEKVSASYVWVGALAELSIGRDESGDNHATPSVGDIRAGAVRGEDIMQPNMAGG